MIVCPKELVPDPACETQVCCPVTNGKRGSRSTQNTPTTSRRPINESEVAMSDNEDSVPLHDHHENQSSTSWWQAKMRSFQAADNLYSYFTKPFQLLFSMTTSLSTLSTFTIFSKVFRMKVSRVVLPGVLTNNKYAVLFHTNPCTVLSSCFFCLLCFLVLIWFLFLHFRTNEALVSILSYVRKPRNLLRKPQDQLNQDIPQVPTTLQVIQVTQEPQVQIQETAKHLDIKR